MEKAIEYIAGGLQCDNPDCDYKDDTSVDYKACVNKPCPICGWNLLTQEDCDASEAMLAMIDQANKILPEWEPGDKGEEVTATMHFHGGKLTVEADLEDTVSHGEVSDEEYNSISLEYIKDLKNTNRSIILNDNGTGYNKEDIIYHLENKTSLGLKLVANHKIGIEALRKIKNQKQ